MEYVRDHNAEFLGALFQHTRSTLETYKGYNFLTRSCLSAESWSISILKDVLTYAKLEDTEYRSGSKSTPSELIFRPKELLKARSAEALRNWIYFQHTGFFLNIKEAIHNWWSYNDITGQVTRPENAKILQVAANLAMMANLFSFTKSLCEEFPRVLSHFGQGQKVAPYQSTLHHSLLFIAIVVPKPVTSAARDRDDLDMINLLLDLGCDVNEKSRLHSSLGVDERLGQYEKHTPLSALLVYHGPQPVDNQEHLNIAKALLDKGADPYFRLHSNLKLHDRESGLWFSLIEFCVRYCDAAWLRLLLKYDSLGERGRSMDLVTRNVDKEMKRTFYYATIRQDKDILQILVDSGLSIRMQSLDEDFGDEKVSHTPTAVCLAMDCANSVLLAGRMPKTRLNEDVLLRERELYSH